MSRDYDLETLVHQMERQPRYSKTAPLAQVMDDLDFFESIDDVVAALREKWSGRGKTATAAASISFVLCLMCLFADAFSGVVAWVLGGVFIVSLVATLVCLSKNHGLGKRDLPDRRYQLVMYLLRRLRKDIPPDEPLTLNLDLTDLDATEKWKGSGRAGDWTTNDYVDPWLQLQVRLADGTHLRLTMEEWLQKRSRSKRNYRGKVKTKHKSKSSTVLGVQLRVKPERHPDLVSLEGAARKALKLPACVTDTRLDVSEDRLALRTRLPLEWLAVDPSQNDTQPDYSQNEYGTGTPNQSRDINGRWVETVPDATRTFLMMMLSLYQVLNYSTASQRKSPSRATP
ncbi:hypothetical protein LZ198_27400 [Myxococcus sp. K15C18031901]|uniref:hypothetical protein n=1 Tax=Myxococcus dinghuensis TaxID=2906761 RepID=UPI0020A7F054|nr:hypothetical protein [Myxococcus dinghuensis]MCP3102606.1 hypothetical protein [Myxococcus dinghuensis]